MDRLQSRVIQRETRNQRPPAITKLSGGYARNEHFSPHFNSIPFDKFGSSTVLKKVSPKQSGYYSIMSIADPNARTDTIIRGSFFSRASSANNTIFANGMFNLFPNSFPLPTDQASYTFRMSLPFSINPSNGLEGVVFRNPNSVPANAFFYDAMSGIEGSIVAPLGRKAIGVANYPSRPIQPNEKKSCLFLTPQERKIRSFIFMGERSGDNISITLEKKYTNYSKDLIAGFNNPNHRIDMVTAISLALKPLTIHAQLFYASPLNTLEKLQLQAYSKTLSFT